MAADIGVLVGTGGNLTRQFGSLGNSSVAGCERVKQVYAQLNSDRNKTALDRAHTSATPH